jgi:hypothetical protein
MVDALNKGRRRKFALRMRKPGIIRTAQQSPAVNVKRTLETATKQIRYTGFGWPEGKWMAERV